MSSTPRLLCLLSALLSGAIAFGMNTPVAYASSDSPEEHGHSGAHDHSFEIGVAPGLAYLVSEKQFTAGLHLHAVMALGASAWGLGLGYERLFDEHSHNTISAVLQYRITDHWSAVVAPGVTIEGDEVLPSSHLETVYEFAVGRFHFGPSLELAVDPEDVHLTLGLHLGFGL